jgi:SAM-dependent methyltransferase
VVILLETLYFLPSAAHFLTEARRVLRPGGRLLVSTINKDCPDFNPNHPLYFSHYGVTELAGKLSAHGLVPECFGIIPMDRPSLRSRAFKPIKKLAIRLNVIPDSMQARQLIKRIVFGPLEPMPRDIAAEPAPRLPPQRLALDQPDTVHQVVLCSGIRN